MKRWWIFISERFPLGSHLPMILAFVLANGMMGWALAWARLPEFSGPKGLLVFLVAFSFFLRLRLFDEIKDYETDLRVNPTRPLARGLISVREVKIALAILCALEIIVCASFSVGVLLSHLVGMAYSFLMYREFFIGDWLRPKLTTYAVSHTIVSVFIAFTVQSLILNLPFWAFPLILIAASFANWGFFNLFEFARKTFAASEERANVESYSKIFGRGGTVILSLSQIVGAELIFFFVSQHLILPLRLLPVYICGLLVFFPGLYFGLKDAPSAAKTFRACSGLYLIVVYLCLFWVFQQ